MSYSMRTTSAKNKSDAWSFMDSLGLNFRWVEKENQAEKAIC
jgi:hypothetical protein